MTQKQPEQPSKIVMLAPVALVLVVYSFMFFSPQQSKLSSAQVRFDSLSATQHETEHQITDTRFESGRIKKKLRDLTNQLAEQQQTQSSLSAQRHRMLHQLESHSLPAATMQRVTRLMQTHQLRVIESQQDAGAASEVEKALKSVRDLLEDAPVSSKSKSRSKTAQHHSGPHHHQTHHHTHFAREVYKLKVRGRFQDLQAALETLAKELEHVLPLSLQMEPMELDSNEARQSQRIWTLTIMV